MAWANLASPFSGRSTQPKMPGPTPLPYSTQQYAQPIGPGLNDNINLQWGADGRLMGPQQVRSFNSDLDYARRAELAYREPEINRLDYLSRSAGEGFGLDLARSQNQGAQLRLQTQGQLDDIATQLGINKIDLEAARRQIPYLDALLFNTGISAELQKQSMGSAAMQQRRALDQDATARGAFGATGAQQQRRSIYDDLVNQITQVDVGTQREAMTTAERQAQARDQEGRLQLEAQGLGMRSDNLKSQLETGLQGLGISNLMSWRELMDAVNSNDYQKSLLGRQILNDALSWAQENQRLR